MGLNRIHWNSVRCPFWFKGYWLILKNTSIKVLCTLFGYESKCFQLELYSKRSEVKVCSWSAQLKVTSSNLILRLWTPSDQVPVPGRCSSLQSLLRKLKSFLSLAFQCDSVLQRRSVQSLCCGGAVIFFLMSPATTTQRGIYRAAVHHCTFAPEALWQGKEHAKS